MTPVDLVNRTEFFKQERNAITFSFVAVPKIHFLLFCIILTTSLYIGKRRGLSKKVAEI